MSELGRGREEEEEVARPQPSEKITERVEKTTTNAFPNRKNETNKQNITTNENITKTHCE